MQNNIATANRDEAYGLTLDGHQKQEEILLKKIILLNRGNGPNKYPSAHDLQSYFPNMLLTSIRRALTVLMQCGEIEATGKRMYRINGHTVPSTTFKVIIKQQKLF
jgi:hypothetical protein